MFRRLRLVGTILVATVAMAFPADSTALQGCQGIDHIKGVKVVIDRLVYDGNDGKKIVLTNELQMQILLELRSRFGNLFPDSPPTPVLCANREPSPDGADFVPDYVSALNGRNDLLEVWGNIISDGLETPSYGANLFMIIIPVRAYDGNQPDLSFHLLSFPKAPRGDLKTASIAMLFGPEFDVYTGLAEGIKAMQNGSYDDAAKYLRTAAIQWAQARQAHSLAPTIDEQRISDYIASLEKVNLEQAAADPHYHGDLLLIQKALSESSP